MTNYKSIFTYPDNETTIYDHPSNGYQYKCLEEIFAEPSAGYVFA